MDAGYFSYDISDSLSVLIFNSMYMSKEDDPSYQLDEASRQLDWLEAHLTEGKRTGRRFILTDHIYAGIRYNSTKLWMKEHNERYFQILRTFAEQIVIEVAGHDHFADLRYHSSDSVPGMADADPKFDFHNLFVAPGVTPNKNQNPGIAYFEVSDDALHAPSGLKMEFMDLNSTYGQDQVSYSDVNWLSFDLEKDFGVTGLDPDSLSDFRNALENDYDKTIDYLVAKIGFDPTNQNEVDQALDIYADKNLITSKKHKTDEFIC